MKVCKKPGAHRYSRMPRSMVKVAGKYMRLLSEKEIAEWCEGIERSYPVPIPLDDRKK